MEGHDELDLFEDEELNLFDDLSQDESSELETEELDLFSTEELAEVEPTNLSSILNMVISSEDDDEMEELGLFEEDEDVAYKSDVVELSTDFLLDEPETREGLIVSNESNTGLSSIEDSKAYSIQSNFESIHMITEMSLVIPDLDQHDEKLEIVQKLFTIDSPSYMDNVAKPAIKQFLTERYKCNISNEEIKELFMTISGIPERNKSSNSPADYTAFYNYVRRLQYEINKILDSNTSSENNRKSESLCIFDCISEGFAVSIKDLQAMQDGNYTHLANVTFKDNRTFFTCGDCGEVSESISNIIAFAYLDSRDSKTKTVPLTSPQICTSCGRYNVLPKKGIIKLLSSVKNKMADSNIISDSNYVNGQIYQPTRDELEKNFPDLFDFFEEAKDEKIEFSINWEEIVNKFYTSVKLIHSNKAKDVDTGTGIKNLAKLMSMQLNDYEELKERALASIIQELSSSRLSRMSRTYVESLDIPTYYNNYREEFIQGLALSINSKAYNQRTNEYDLDKFNKDYDKYLEYVESFDSCYNDNIDELYRVSYHLSITPISNIKLTNEMIYDYLSEDKLRCCLEQIADLMIISHTCEDFINTFKPRVMRGGVASRNASYDIRMSKIKEINKDKSMAYYIDKYCEFFEDTLNRDFSVNVSLSRSLHTTAISHDYKFYNLIGSYCRACLAKDYFDMVNIHNELITNEHDNLSSLCRNTNWSYIGDMIVNTPRLDISNASKGEFYFGKGYTLQEYRKLLELFSQKRFVPKILIGDSFGEKYDYYKNLESTFDVELLNLDNFEEFIDRHYIECLSLRNIDNSICYDNILLYFFSKDFLLSLKDLSLKYVCRILYLNVDIIGIYLDSNFAIPDTRYEGKHLIYECILDSACDSILQDDSLSEEAKKSELSVNEEYLIEKYKKIPQVAEIIKNYFDS